MPDLRVPRSEMLYKRVVIASLTVGTEEGTWLPAAGAAVGWRRREAIASKVGEETELLGLSRPSTRVLLRGAFLEAGERERDTEGVNSRWRLRLALDKISPLRFNYVHAAHRYGI